MIERLSGVFHGIRRITGKSEFVKLVNECASRNETICRLHIYPYSVASQIILIVYINDSKLYTLGFDQNMSSFVSIGINNISDMIGECYVEIYQLTKDHVDVDMDVIRHAARIKGIENLVSEFMIEDFVNMLLQSSEAVEEKFSEKPEAKEIKRKEVSCDIIIREVIDTFSSPGVNENLSQHLSNPSTIAKILLYSEEYVIATKECKELIAYLDDIVSGKDYVAVKLEVGDYSIWLVRSGEERGMHDFLRGKPASSGTAVIEKWDEIKKVLNGALSGGKRVNVYVYTIKKDTLK